MVKTILILAANPKNTSRLRLDEEVREIANGLERSLKREQFILKQIWAARPKDVRRAMLDIKPNIVHFCGHGEGEEGIAFEDETGRTQFVGAEVLAGFFKLFSKNVECVILNACYSEIQADAIARHIDYVIGMKRGIQDTAAIEFAVAFYDALASGEPIEFAYLIGYNAIQWASSAKPLPEDLEPILKSKTNYNEGLEKGAIIIPDHQASSQIFSNRSEVDGLLNREMGEQFLKDYLPEIVQNLSYSSTVMSIVIIDVDNLTLINKHYSREVGDQVLLTVATLIGDRKGINYKGRCGDDTFYVILPGIDVNKSKSKAKNWGNKIANYTWDKIAANLRVTCSFGVAQIYQSNKVDDLVVRAALGLITAKNAGRNLVVVGPEHLPRNQSRNYRDYFS